MAEAVDRDLVGVVESAAAGNEIDFGRIVAAYHGEMVRICLAIAREQTVADEAVQAAWVTAWYKLGSLREPQRIRPWLISVAVNEARQLLRGRRKRTAVESAADVSWQTAVDPATGVSNIDLQASLERLDPDDRALLVLRYVAGFDSAELSHAVGISAAGVRTRLRRLLERLREDLRHG